MTPVIRVFAETTEPRAPGWLTVPHEPMSLVVGSPTLGKPTLALGNVDHLMRKPKEKTPC